MELGCELSEQGPIRFFCGDTPPNPISCGSNDQPGRTKPSPAMMPSPAMSPEHRTAHAKRVLARQKRVTAVIRIKAERVEDLRDLLRDYVNAANGAQLAALYSAIDRDGRQGNRSEPADRLPSPAMMPSPATTASKPIRPRPRRDTDPPVARSSPQVVQRERGQSPPIASPPSTAPHRGGRQPFRQGE